MTPVPAEAEKNTKGVAAKNKPFQVPGFLAATGSAEIKKGTSRQDLGLIFSEVPAVAAGVFTLNQVKAAPIWLNLERIAGHEARGILVNSGNANACTGAAGLRDAQKISQRISQELSIPDSQVFLASTGVIGQRMPVSRVLKAIPALTRSLSQQGLPAVAEAIMTTDTFPKILSQELIVGKKKVHIVAMAKGAGMIQPDMATMLCFVLTDLAISPDLLNLLLRKAVAQSFNRITVDGDTSTNDMVLVLANGLAGNPLLEDLKSPGAQSFGRALEALLLVLAKMIIRDGEGATKALTLQIEGARSEAEAKTMALTVANSPLVKTALFGQDANWGRIMAALGRSGVSFDPNRVDIYFDAIQVVK
ncbi:MAG: bifunctional glutamate N-acetyltransferase/amino-acid acetyltransferase ArgJ, partial [Pseudomonadota bacterium]